MGVVYEAMDSRLKRAVAVKLLPPNPQVYPRFLREARTAAQVNHPNVVSVYDVGKTEDALYLVMELVRGVTAQELVATRGPLPWEKATQLLLAVCRGLKAAHDVGLIHRDIKPANILCSESHEPRLADFGLAKATDSSGNLTHAGTVIGTPEYMSPEQCRGETLDERTDIYSLGVTFYFLLVGKPPFCSPDRMKVLFSHCAELLPDLKTTMPELPEACSKIIQKALAKKRADRFQNTQAVIDALESLGTEPQAALTDEEIREAEQKANPIITAIPRQRTPWRTVTAIVVAASFLITFALIIRTFFREATVTASDRTLPTIRPTTRSAVPTVQIKQPISNPSPNVLPSSSVSWFDSSFTLHRQWYLRDAASQSEVACFFPDSKRIVISQGERRIAIAQPPSNRFTMIECLGKVLATAVGGRNGEWIAVSTSDRKIRLHALPEGKTILSMIDCEDGTVEHLAAKGPWLAVATSSGIKVYDVSNPNKPQHKPLTSPAGLSLTAFAFAPEGPYLAGLTVNRQLDSWDLSKNALTNRVNLPADSLHGLAFGSKGQVVVLGKTADKMESIVFDQLGQSSFQIRSAPQDATTMTTIGNGTAVAFAGKQRIGVYDPFMEQNEPKTVATLPPNVSIQSLQVSRNGRRAICGLENGILVTFDADAKPAGPNDEKRDQP